MTFSFIGQRRACRSDRCLVDCSKRRPPLVDMKSVLFALLLSLLAPAVAQGDLTVTVSARPRPVGAPLDASLFALSLFAFFFYFNRQFFE